MKVCGYCNKPYEESENHDKACRYHPEFYFPYDIDKDGIHSKGWQCCGSTDMREPGCTFSRHDDMVEKVYRPGLISYDYKKKGEAVTDDLPEEEE